MKPLVRAIRRFERKIPRDKDSVAVVAEKVTFRQMTRNSQPKSLLANLARPFGR